MARGILVPWPGIEPVSPAWQGRFLTTGPPGKSLTWRILSYLANMWNECNCAVVWTFFGIAFLWNWNENWLFPVLRPLLSFPNLLAYWVRTSTASSFRIWTSSAGVPSPPLALFTVALPKTHFSLVKSHLTLGCPLMSSQSACPPLLHPLTPLCLTGIELTCMLPFWWHLWELFRIQIQPVREEFVQNVTQP